MIKNPSVPLKVELKDNQKKIIYNLLERMMELDCFIAASVTYTIIIISIS